LAGSLIKQCSKKSFSSGDLAVEKTARHDSFTYTTCIQMDTIHDYTYKRLYVYEKHNRFHTAHDCVCKKYYGKGERDGEKEGRIQYMTVINKLLYVYGIRDRVYTTRDCVCMKY